MKICYGNRVIFTRFKHNKIKVLRGSEGRRIRKLITNKLCRREMDLTGNFSKIWNACGKY
jgi:hypothetical protein